MPTAAEDAAAIALALAAYELYKRRKKAAAIPPQGPGEQGGPFPPQGRPFAGLPLVGAGVA